MSARIGLDVGGVIIDSIRNDKTDTSFFTDNFMATSPVPGMYEAVQELVSRVGANNLFIISKCGKVISNKTRLWLRGNGFYNFTGFNPANLFFCQTREGKAPIARTLGLTDFVDDHADVLRHMEQIVPRRYLFGPQSDQTQDTTGLIVVRTWAEVVTHITQIAA